MAYKFLREMDLREDERKRLVIMCQSFHKKVRDSSKKFFEEQGRYNYVTPTSYLELISLFQTLLNAKRQENKKLTSRYTVGLEKVGGISVALCVVPDCFVHRFRHRVVPVLMPFVAQLASSAEQVATMQDELTALQPQLVQTVKEVEALMSQIDKEKKEVVEPKAAIVKVDEEAAQKKAQAAKSIKDECEADLAEAMPILNEALAALDTIKEADINYIKKLGNPPATIKLVMEAVCVILDVKPAKGKDDAGKPILDYWKPSIVILSDKNFVLNLKNFDKDNINPKIIGAIRDKYLSNEQFTPENAKKASSAAEGLCKWVFAMSSYDKVRPGPGCSAALDAPEICRRPRGLSLNFCWTGCQGRGAQESNARGSRGRVRTSHEGPEGKAGRAQGAAGQDGSHGGGAEPKHGKEEQAAGRGGAVRSQAGASREAHRRLGRRKIQVRRAVPRDAVLTTGG